MNREALSLQLEDHLRSGRASAPTSFYFTQVAPPGGQGPAVDAVYFTASSRSNAAATVDIYLLAADRADWLAHQRTPTPEGWVSYATRCWIVTASPSVAAADDVPSGWGLLVAETPGAEDLFTVAKRPQARRAVIDAPLLLTLLTNQHDSHVQRIAGIRSQYKRHAGRPTPSLLRRSAATSSTGSGTQGTEAQPLKEVSGGNSLPTQPEGGHLPAGPHHPGHRQPPPRTPQGTTSGGRAAQVLPA
ncbi:hypothetical protein [Streptomyces sp. S1D4-20]|uniref:hypothetical protein n=1 Tax=Streptomyces sp. S1D4-20 TaxID=2594462 RepID=UPI001162AB95|nr:hypothetical protein [Streptomyces sp. S1D4-20]QDN54227.1 hypothetical protein FNV67_01265 [Streptomyces sp. S1D4-20]